MHIPAEEVKGANEENSQVKQDLHHHEEMKAQHQQQEPSLQVKVLPFAQDEINNQDTPGLTCKNNVLVTDQSSDIKLYKGSPMNEPLRISEKDKVRAVCPSNNDVKNDKEGKDIAQAEQTSHNKGNNLVKYDHYKEDFKFEDLQSETEQH